MAARRVGRRAGRLVPRHQVPDSASAAAVTGSGNAGWLAGGLLRRVSVRTGVSDEEAFGPLPGDEFIAHPMVERTRGVTVHVIPVLLGGGTPLFGPLGSSITLERANALVTPAATHMMFRVVR
jgi:hypothetical protein